MKWSRIFVGDFETTVYKGQTDTEVWASALVEMWTEDVKIFTSIQDTYEHLTMLDETILIYYHNLKFDGAFWIDYLIRELKYTQAYTMEDNKIKTIKWLKNKDMKNNTFKYMIADNGMFYSITIKHNNRIIEIRDSYKLLPFSAERIGKSFKTKHQKLSIEYEGYRKSGGKLTDEEKRYIANDVLIIKEALEIMYNDGHNKLTIGSCCLTEYKKTVSRYDYLDYYPNLSAYELDEEIYGSTNADKYIRRAYKGGWCYVNPKYQSQILTQGYTLDVNSLYPSVMQDPTNIYPVGEPHFFKGERPHQLFFKNVYYFIRIRTKFRVKENHLPFIQVKNSFMYAKHRALTTSNYIDKEGNEHEYFIKKDGTIVPCVITLTLTMTDYELFHKHYDVEYEEILDGVWFYTQTGKVLFGKYIEKYKEIKKNSTGAVRELAKLFLNNLYGKTASSDNSSFKVGYLDEESDSIKYFIVTQNDKNTMYIPVGSAITSYARKFTIDVAQKNIENFVYADTDSVHCVGVVDDIVGVTLDDTEFNCWKHEKTWDIGYFARQKTYIERDENGYEIKCAGMPDKCKKLFERSITGDLAKDDEDLSDDEREFLSEKRTLLDFDIGLKIPGKLMPKRIKGGIVLTETTFEMR